MRCTSTCHFEMLIFWHFVGSFLIDSGQIQRCSNLKPDCTAPSFSHSKNNLSSFCVFLFCKFINWSNLRGCNPLFQCLWPKLYRAIVNQWLIRDPFFRSLVSRATAAAAAGWCRCDYHFQNLTMRMVRPVESKFAKTQIKKSNETMLCKFHLFTHELNQRGEKG